MIIGYFIPAILPPFMRAWVIEEKENFAVEKITGKKVDMRKIQGKKI